MTHAYRFAAGALALTAALALAGCGSWGWGNDPDDPAALPPAPVYDEGQFDRIHRAEQVRRDAVATAGPWAAKDGAGRRIAVLLPAAGASPRLRDSLQAGLLTAAASADPAQRGALTFYALEDYPDVAAAYRQAQAEGAQVIIGPLAADAVRQLARTQPLEVATIALNTADWGWWQEPLLFQLALPLEDEGRAAAQQLYRAGYRRPFVVTEASRVGERARDGFLAELARLAGARPVLIDAFAPTPDGARAAAAAVAAARVVPPGPPPAPGVAPLPVRAGDSVFLAGSRAGLAALAVALPAAGVHEVPLVATSHANDPERPVNGLYVVDVPWMIDPQVPRTVFQRAGGPAWPATLRDTAAYHSHGHTLDWAGRALKMDGVPSTTPGFPAAYRRADPRLFALAVDSYRLAQNIHWLARRPGRSLAGATGWLRLGPGGRIEREWMLGRLHDGQVAPATLPPAPPAPPPAALPR